MCAELDDFPIHEQLSRQCPSALGAVNICRLNLVIQVVIVSVLNPIDAAVVGGHPHRTVFFGFVYALGKIIPVI